MSIRDRISRAIGNLAGKVGSALGGGGTGMTARRGGVRETISRRLIEVSKSLGAARGSAVDARGRSDRLQIGAGSPTGSVRTGSRRDRLNAMFEAEIARVMSDDATSKMYGGVTQERVRLFYRSTQRMWQGHPVSERNRRIMEGLGLPTLGDAYSLIMAEQERAVAEADRWRAQRMSGGGMGVAAGQEVGEIEASPNYLALVRMY